MWVIGFYVTALVDDEVEKFYKSLEGKTTEEKKKAIEEYIKTNADKSQKNKRDLYSLICFHYGYTLDQVREINYPDLIILRDTIQHRLCEHLGVSYPENREEKDSHVQDDVIKDPKKDNVKKFDGGNINDVKAFFGVK